MTLHVPVGTKVRISVELLRELYDRPEHQSEVVVLSEIKPDPAEPDVWVLVFSRTETPPP